MIPKASENLPGYKNWLNSLTALPVGTMISWTAGYKGVTLAGTVKPGQFTKVVRVRKSNGVSDLPVHAQVYELVSCTSSGKEFKAKFYWRVGNMAHLLAEGTATIANNG